MESIESKKARQKELVAERIRQISRSQSLKISEPPVPHTLTPASQTLAPSPPEVPPAIIPLQDEQENEARLVAERQRRVRIGKFAVFMIIGCPIAIVSIGSSIDGSETVLFYFVSFKVDEYQLTF